jgi:HK97 gp10 family phage protein
MEIGEYNSVVYELGIRDISGLVANFYKADRDITLAVTQLVDATTELFDEVWASLIPVDTSFMLEHRRIRKTSSGLGFDAGWDAADFLGAGLAFYPFFQEFGTVKMAAQPSLGPAYEYIAPMFQSDLRSILQGAIERLNRSGGDF